MTARFISYFFKDWMQFTSWNAPEGASQEVRSMVECCGTCKTAAGIVVGIAGVALLLAGLGSLGSATGAIIAGVLLAIYGIIKIVHGVGACPMCSKEK